MSVMPTTLAASPLSITTVVVPVVGLVRLDAPLVVPAARATVLVAAPLVALAVAVGPVLVPAPVVVVVVVQAAVLVDVLVAVLVAVLVTVALSVADKGREKWRLRLMTSATDLLMSNQQPCAQKLVCRRTLLARTLTTRQHCAGRTNTGFVVTGPVAGPARPVALVAALVVALVLAATVVRRGVLVVARVLALRAVVVLAPARALAVLVPARAGVLGALVPARQVAALAALASKERFHGILERHRR